MNLSEAGAINAAKSDPSVPMPVGLMPEPCLDGQTALSSQGSVLRAGRVRKKNRLKTGKRVPLRSQGSEMSSPVRDVSGARSCRLPARWGFARNGEAEVVLQELWAGSPSSNAFIF